jgi:hypothetical protein
MAARSILNLFALALNRLGPVVVVGSAVLVSACAVSREPLLITVPQPNLRPVMRLDHIYDYRTAAATVAWIFDRDLGFTPFPTTFRFYPHQEAFEKALLDAGYDEALARATSRTMTAVGGYRGVLLNDGKFSLLEWSERVAMLAHEMGHSLQYELGGGRRGASDQWVREGFADWLSIRVLERLDGISMQDGRRARHRDFESGRSRAPRLRELVTFPQWVRAGEQHGRAMYGLSFLAVDFLLERHGVPAMLDYFRRFAASDDRAANFRAAFGEDLETFEAALSARLRRR